MIPVLYKIWAIHFIFEQQAQTFFESKWPIRMYNSENIIILSRYRKRICFVVPATRASFLAIYVLEHFDQTVQVDR